MQPSDIVETTLGTTLSVEQSRLINGFLILSTYGEPSPEGSIQVGRNAENRTVRDIRNLAMQGFKAPAIAIELGKALSVVYSVARYNEITLNTKRSRVTVGVVDIALDLLEDGDGVSVIGVAAEVDISPASLEKIITGVHPIMTSSQVNRSGALLGLDYTLIR